jgi:hypothetical protein
VSSSAFEFIEGAGAKASANFFYGRLGHGGAKSFGAQLAAASARLHRNSVELESHQTIDMAALILIDA